MNWKEVTSMPVKVKRPRRAKMSRIDHELWKAGLLTPLARSNPNGTTPPARKRSARKKRGGGRKR